MERHPAEEALEKKAGFMSVLPWLIIAAPFVSQLVDKMRGTGSPLPPWAKAFRQRPMFGASAGRYAGNLPKHL